MKATLFAALTGVGVAMAAAFSLASQSAFVAPDLIGRGWEEITFDGKQPNRFSSCGARCIEIRTDSSVSMIGRAVSVDLSETPLLDWEWRIDAPVVQSDLTVKGADDRAVALYVTFPYDPDSASFSERLLRPIVEMARGDDAPSRVISYIWGGFGESGQVLESPFFGSVNAMIIGRNQTAPVGQWVGETIDVVADHQRIFGSEPMTAAHILLSADSDDTGVSNRAYVRNIQFRAR